MTQAMRRAVVYLRVSTIDQTTANQERELREIAGRMGCEIVRVYKDHGISGTRGRDKRPAFDKLCRDAARREFDVVMAWSVDRLGRSLQDLVGFLSVETKSGKVRLLLCARGEWPRGCGACEQRKDRAPCGHSITSSARAMKVGGMVRPRAAAALRLMISSNSVAS
jgi:resolvase-like protein